MAEQTDIEPVEVVDAEVVELEPRTSAQIVQATATQAALVAAGGFAIGAATVAALKHHRQARPPSARARRWARSSARAASSSTCTCFATEGGLAR